MKIRGLWLFFALSIMVWGANPAFSQQAAEKPKAGRKTAKKPIAACGLYLNGSYITGWFRKPEKERSGRFSREGLGPGAACYYRPRGLFSLGIGGEYYIGNLNFEMHEKEYDASFSYLEGGFKEWVRIALNLNQVKFSLSGGVQKTGNRQIQVNSFEFMLNGSSFDISKFAAEHMQNRGNLEIWEAGFEARFPFRNKTAFTFGLLWQRYIVSAHAGFDAEGKAFLTALQLDADSFKSDYNLSSDFFYITPGLERCGKKLCFSLSVPWAVFDADVGSWGIQTKLGYRF